VPANPLTISNPVNAETHNALKDAVLNIQKKLGVKNIPETDSLNQILKSCFYAWNLLKIKK
jgi:hypothetical protein